MGRLRQGGRPLGQFKTGSWPSGQLEAGLGVPAGTQPPHRARLGWQRHPPGDAPGACPRLRVVSDPRKPPAQLNNSRQLSLLIEGGADRGSIGLGDDEHPQSMMVRTTADKRDERLSK